MANQRAPGQVLVGFWADESVQAKIDAARGPIGRSAFLRRAVADHLRSKGITVSDYDLAAPDRAGKGGPKPKVNSTAKTKGLVGQLEQAVLEEKAKVDPSLGQMTKEHAPSEPGDPPSHDAQPRSIQKPSASKRRPKK